MKNDVQNENILKVLIYYVINKNLNRQVFYEFLGYLMTRNSEVRRGQVIRIQKSFEQFLSKLDFASENQNQLIKDLGSLMVDGVVYLLENHLEILEKETVVVNLCQFFLNQIINRYQNTIVKSSLCVIPIRLNLYGSLFLASMRVLNKKFNLGGIGNFETFDAMKIPLLELISFCLFVLNYAVDENKKLILQSHFIHNFQNYCKIFGQEAVHRGIEDMIVWLLFQYPQENEQITAPFFQHLNRINQNLLAIFNTLFENEEIAKVVVSILNTHITKLHSILTQKLSKKQIGQQAIENAKSAISFYNFVLDKVVKNPAVTKSFIHEQRGLELMFKILSQTFQ